MAAIGTSRGGSQQHNPCSENWQGVVCTCTRSEPEYHPYSYYYYYAYYNADYYSSGPPSSCNVQKLFLIGYQLDGTLPPTIGNFSLLASVHISNNQQLLGTIPSQVGRLTALEMLGIANNRITGTISVAFGSLKRLISLQLHVRVSIFFICSALYSLTLTVYAPLFSVSRITFSQDIFQVRLDYCQILPP
jgi:hypothetical protein